MASAPAWREVPERGSGAAIAVLVKIATAVGRAPARLVLRMVAFYYVLFFGSARRAANAFLSRVGRTPGFWAAYRQILRFAEVALDALFFLRGKTRHFEVAHHGHDHLEALRREKRGAILLGAHLGSFYAMRGRGREQSLPIYPLVYTKNATRINDAFRRLDPTSTTELVEMGDGDVTFMLRVRDIVESGGLVAILADRVPKGGKSVTVRFLGGEAELPIGPWLLAQTLRCPVYFTCGIYRHPRRYELHCEPLAERVELPRGKRMEAIAEHAQRYADKLAEHCRSAPDNWFNFYDFWKR